MPALAGFQCRRGGLFAGAVLDNHPYTSRHVCCMVLNIKLTVGENTGDMISPWTTLEHDVHFVTPLIGGHK